MNPIGLWVTKNEAGDKTLDVHVYGIIDSGWSDSVDASRIAKDLVANKDAKAITVHINSMGGNMFDGIAIHNLLKGHGAPVTSVVEGWAASAASIVAMTGKTVMGSGAMMLIHNPWTIAMGDATELRRVAADLDKARDSLVTIYKQKTGKDAAELRALLTAETLMTAEQAKRQGFADEIEQDADDAGEPQDRGGDVVFRAVAFPRDRVAPQFMALVKPPAPGNPPPQPQAKEEPIMQITREMLAAKEPELLKALLDEGKAAGVEEGTKAGHAAGAAAERARLQAIDELPVRGHATLIAEAKYGAEPKTAEQVAMLAWKAEAEVAGNRLDASRAESKVVAGVRQSAPQHIDQAARHAEEERLVRAIVGNDNTPSGGAR